MKRGLALALLLSLTLLSQTRTKTSQIQAPITDQVKLVGIYNGRLVFLTIGAGLLVTTDNTISAQTSFNYSESKLTRQTNGSWGPVTCTVFRVFRNGLRQFNAVDYIYSSNTIKFTDGTIDPSEPDDVVILECVR